MCGVQDLHLGAAGMAGVLACSSSRVAGVGHHLMATPERGPGQATREALGRLNQREQEAADLRDRQGEEVC
jgi:hypothetical protein